MKEKNTFNTILKTFLSLNILIFILKFISFYKQTIIAKYYGTSIYLDFYSISSSFVRGIASIFIDAFSIAFIKKYLEIKKNEVLEKANNFLSGLLIFITFILLIILIFFIFYSFPIARFLGKEYSFENICILSKYIKITAPYIIFSAQIIIFSVILESEKKFFFPRIEPLISSLITIIFIFSFKKNKNTEILIFADIFSAFLFSVLLLKISNLNYKFRFINPLKNKDVKKIVFLSFPLILSNATYRINTIVDSILSGKIIGGPSALSYAVPLEQIVVITFIFSIGNVLFSYMINYINSNKKNRTNYLLIKILRFTIIIIIPISVITIFYSKFFVKIIYYRGNFNIESLYLTSLALKGYAFGFTFIILKDFCIKFLLAHGKNTISTIFGIGNTFINIILSLILFKKYSLFGITIATSISSFINFIFLFIYINKNYNIKIKFFIYLFFQVTFSSIICIIILDKIIILDSVIKLFIFCFLYLIFYIFILYVLKIKELKKIFKLISLVKNKKFKYYKN